jgi:hypothetical protein
MRVAASKPDNDDDDNLDDDEFLDAIKKLGEDYEEERPRTSPPPCSPCSSSPCAISSPYAKIVDFHGPFSLENNYQDDTRWKKVESGIVGLHDALELARRYSRKSVAYGTVRVVDRDGKPVGTFVGGVADYER